MINWLEGEVLKLTETGLILKVAGVGYKINTYEKLNLGQKTEMYIETVVKQEVTTLYGFLREEEHELFLLLSKINGVGGKMIMKILEHFKDIDKIRVVLEDKNIKAMKCVSGVGERVASRIVSEIDRKTSFFKKSNSDTIEENKKKEKTTIIRDLEDLVISAVKGLGYNSKEELDIVRGVLEKEDLLLYKEGEESKLISKVLKAFDKSR